MFNKFFCFNHMGLGTKIWWVLSLNASRGYGPGYEPHFKRACFQVTCYSWLIIGCFQDTCYSWRLPRGLPLAATKHPWPSARHVLVGLRIPDRRHGQSDHSRGQQHVEQQSYRFGEWFIRMQRNVSFITGSFYLHLPVQDGCFPFDDCCNWFPMWVEAWNFIVLHTISLGP